MALNDIYRITLTQVWDTDGPISHNVFYYKQSSEIPPDPGSTTLLAIFSSFIHPKVLAIQSAIVSSLQIAVENIIPGTDNAYQNYVVGTQVGGRNAVALPPFNAWAFRLNRNSSAVRNGQKRFMGVAEADQFSGNPEAAMVTLFNDLASALSAPIGTIGVSSTFVPRIFRAGRPSKTIPAKVIPAMLQADFDVSSAVFVKISSQNSRKFGVGI